MAPSVDMRRWRRTTVDVKVVFRRTTMKFTALVAYTSNIKVQTYSLYIANDIMAIIIG
jgi:hypothetical protein